MAFFDDAPLVLEDEVASLRDRGFDFTFVELVLEVTSL